MTREKAIEYINEARESLEIIHDLCLAVESLLEKREIDKREADALSIIISKIKEIIDKINNHWLDLAAKEISSDEEQEQ